MNLHLSQIGKLVRACGMVALCCSGVLLLILGSQVFFSSSGLGISPAARLFIWTLGLFPVLAFSIALYFAERRATMSVAEVVIVVVAVVVLAWLGTYYDALAAYSGREEIAITFLAAYVTALGLLVFRARDSRGGDPTLFKPLLSLREVFWESWREPNQSTLAHTSFGTRSPWVPSDTMSTRINEGLYTGRKGVARFQGTFLGARIQGEQLARSLTEVHGLGTAYPPWTLVDIGGAEGTLTASFVSHLIRLGWPVPTGIVCYEPAEFDKEYSSVLRSTTGIQRVTFNQKAVPLQLGAAFSPSENRIILASHSLYQPLDHDFAGTVEWLAEQMAPTEYAVILLSSEESQHYRFRRMVFDLLGMRAASGDVTGEMLAAGIESLSKSRLAIRVQIVLDTALDVSSALGDTSALHEWLSYFLRIPMHSFDDVSLETSRTLLSHSSLRLVEAPECLRAQLGNTLPTEAQLVLHKGIVLIVQRVGQLQNRGDSDLPASQGAAGP